MHNGGIHVVLEKTIFYPTSGGQPHDLGTLNDIPVLDVLDEDESIIHVLAQPLDRNDVRARIDWRRRYDHMQQHTGQHLLSAVFEELYRIPTLSFHMGAESSSIELGAKEISVRQIDEAILKATGLARANPTIATLFEDAETVAGLRKPSARAGTIRIIEIPNIDRSACGGTHVAHLAEVLPLQIRESERVRGNVRLSFVCGNRALAQTQQDFQNLSRTAKALGASLGNVGTQVAALLTRLADSEKHGQRLENEAAARTGIDLYTKTIPDSDGIRRLLIIVPMIEEAQRQQATAFSTQPKAILLIQSVSSLMLACSPDSGINAGEMLKRVLARFGARGGGSPTIAQGSLPDAEVVQELRHGLGFKTPTS